jgi:hypothetical protein
MKGRADNQLAAGTENCPIFVRRKIQEATKILIDVRRRGL